MSDNEGSVFLDADDEDKDLFELDLNGDEADEDFEKKINERNIQNKKAGSSRRIYIAEEEDKLRLKELERVHEWADITQHSLLKINLAALDVVEPWPYVLWKRVKKRTSLRAPVMNLYSAALSLCKNGWRFEHFAAFSLALTVTLVISLVPQDSPRLASQLDFHYLVTSLVYLVTFGSQQTLSRRDNTVRCMMVAKTILCQLGLALLLWNRDRPRPSPDFEGRVVLTFQRGAYHLLSPLTIPTWNRTRHYVTKSGMAFRHAMRKRVEHHRMGFTRFQVDLHLLFEEVKEKGTIENHETTRLVDYARQLQVAAEQLILIKEYRTTNVARSFIRVFILVCPPMMAVYYSYVSGNIPDSSGAASFTFSVMLFLASISLLLMLVQLNRAMEDPTTTDFKGDVIDISDELDDLYERICLLAEYCRDKKAYRDSLRMEEDEDSLQNEHDVNDAMRSDPDLSFRPDFDRDPWRIS